MRERLHRLYTGQTNIDFIGKRKLWFTISAVAILACALLLVTAGLNYGIEFEGGVSIQAPVPSDGPLGTADDTDVVSTLTDTMEELGAADAQVQVATDGDERSVLVQTKEIADPERQTAVVSAVAETVGVSIAETDSQRIGSKWGSEITSKAVRALLIFIVAVTIFISWRFEWKMAIAATAALIHDLVITSGVYSLVGFEVTPSTVIAILTILGYSLYDTVVVFDKVEEDTSLMAATGRSTYQDAANLAMNQVFMRSLNTSLATLLPVAALLFVGAGLLGAGTMKDLALALFVGLLLSAYSSIYVATPLLTVMKEREPRYRSVREKVLREARAAAAAPATVASASDRLEGAPARAIARPATSGPSAPARARAGTKKARRRRKR
ncbi:MAG: protein translocase subunit SecF [Actinomycetota bacterium]